ncbi:MAG: hypothetical protein IPL53_15535 [Ignavibacteria bacterium]|nr:hypothetical protein [Ignavibacteria bacterium]
MFLFSCGKETSKPAAQNSKANLEENKADKTGSASDITDDSVFVDNSQRDIGHIQYGIMTVPPEMKYAGSVVVMAQWKDRSGSNVLFITETAENSNEDNRSKELFGYHYVTDDEGSRLLWKINDFVKDCPVDLTLEYIDKSLVITDLDKNGIGESSFLYKMSCKGDVSADDMKLIMHEGANKYAIRGVMNLVMEGQELEKGSMKVDPSFDKAPETFREFAKDQWGKFRTEKVGD